MLLASRGDQVSFNTTAGGDVHLKDKVVAIDIYVQFVRLLICNKHYIQISCCSIKV